MILTVETLQPRVQEHSPVWFFPQSPTATGIAVLLEARTHPTAPPRIWDSVAQLTTCPPRAKSQKEPCRIREVVSTLHAASLRRLNNLVWRLPTPRWVTYLPSGQRNRMARPNRWPTSACALYCVMCFMFYFWECFKEEGGGGHPELGFRRPVFHPGSAHGFDPRVPLLTFLGLIEFISPVRGCTVWWLRLTPDWQILWIYQILLWFHSESLCYVLAISSMCELWVKLIM